MGAIPNASKLPGAFLFLTVTGKDDKGFATVAYDDTIQKGTKLKDLQAKYLTGGGALPYNERFGDLSGGLKIWDGVASTSYGGIFGKNKSHISPVWPYTGDNVKNGIYISYWNFPNSNAAGLHTSSISQHFNHKGVVPYMSLYRGSTQNLVKGDLVGSLFKSITIDWYATYTDIGDLGWSTETI